jgi:hypothetical protein
MNDAMDQHIFRPSNKTTVIVFSIPFSIVLGTCLWRETWLIATIVAGCELVFLWYIIKITGNTIELNQDTLRFSHNTLPGWTNRATVPRNTVIGLRRDIGGHLTIKTVDGRKYEVAVGSFSSKDITELCQYILNDVNEYHTKA